MYHSFMDNSFTSVPILSVSQMPMVQEMYRREVVRVQEYYRKLTAVVEQDHLLVRLLAALDSLYDDDRERFMSTVYSEHDGLERIFGICSATNPRPVLNNGLFFNKNTSDVLLSVIDYFDTVATDPNKLVPVRFLSHPFTDLNMAMPDGKYRTVLNESGVSIAAIDIPKLAYIYHHWIKNGDVDLGKKHRYFPNFVYRHILTRMIPSELDVAFFNRFCNIYRGYQVSNSFQVHLFGVTDYTQRVDDVIKYMIEKINNTSPIYANVIQSLPAICANRTVDVLKIPDNLINRNNGWVVLLSRVDIYILIMNMVSNLGNVSDITIIKNQVKILARAIENDNAIGPRLPYGALEKMNRLKYLVS